MVFSSLVFLVIFFPLVVFLYFYSKNIKVKNFILFVFSILFYAWGEPTYIILMLASILVNYLGAIFINKHEGKKRKLIFIIVLLFNLLALAYFKYINFLLENLLVLFPTLKTPSVNVILPIGISFYTFQILSYVIDVYWKNVKVQKNILNLGLYISLFPQLVAGPIVRYETVAEELASRKESFTKAIQGLKRFIYGLGKKVLIANNAAIIADQIYNNNLLEHGSATLWLAALAYTIQIYFDFSGYSDMAIGMGKIFGFNFLENFNYPYLAKNITDFWRRWHISLSSWFRDYVYIPLGGNRVSKLKWLRNILVVWFLTGLWHGASWNYVLWGMYYAVILLLEKFVLKKFLDSHKISSRIYTIILFMIGWVIFRLEDFGQMTYALKTMFIFKESNFLIYLANNSDLIFSIPFVIIGIFGSLPIFKNFFDKNKNKTMVYAIENLYLVLILVLSIISLVSVKYNPFIYFKF